MRSDLQCLDHVRIAVVPACLWLIGGGTESRPVMSLQHASRRRAAIEGTLQVKGHDAVSAPTGGPRCFGAALGVRSTAVVTRAFTPRSARPCCVSRTRGGPEPPGHARSTRTRKMRVALQMEGFQAEDRHNPSPHIALLTAALKSAYRNTASTSSRTTAELWELLIPGGRK